MRLAFVLLPLLWVLNGCLTGPPPPCATVLHFSLTPGTGTVRSDDAELQEAVQIIDSLVKREGFRVLDESKHREEVKIPDEHVPWDDRPLFQRYYVGPDRGRSVFVYVSFTRSRLEGKNKLPGSKAVIAVAAQRGPYFTPPPESQRLRDDIAQELEKRFGKESVETPSPWIRNGTNKQSRHSHMGT